MPNPEYIVDNANQRRAVILTLSAFETLMEDLADLAAVAERREEQTLSHDELLADLKSSGLL
uniref:Antitoxin Phd_YefM, type II toxin-antitoxin system n=1 Tax=Candidatus Kentrum sp. SD TaxID=2126332 RepID=A0A450YWA6_9GAMM|nr:MAG: hypothetical protein BECKSD772F_GA0070984_12523 [Candidatus Kentron sp. SD]VFK49833.1 MAG: hypothetical protein BECKSD772E_GA0070983_12513 [Candidatus Kentron sp. SD]